ncbi:class I SAM-dependent methyltransferase [Pseudonocardia sp. T1-2H]|uniref:class I SAM-dependent methyltransferase n=1 Tax=Pseudonocardia sp. T1-2H TaxID=3128899 RepID=UPI0040548B32
MVEIVSNAHDLGRSRVHDQWDITNGIGLTALAVAAARAVEAGRPDALVRDRWAGEFVRAARSVDPSVGFPAGAADVGDDVELWLPMTDYMAVRSRVFDDALLDGVRAARQVVVLAAGLDVRALRLPWPPAVQTCGIAASSVRGSSRTPPKVTPAAGSTSLASSHAATRRTKAAAVVSTVRALLPIDVPPSCAGRSPGREGEYSEPRMTLGLRTGSHCTVDRAVRSHRVDHGTGPEVTASCRVLRSPRPERQGSGLRGRGEPACPTVQGPRGRSGPRSCRPSGPATPRR